MPQTNNYRQLSREEELELFRRWRENGDRPAYETLVASQLPWARRLVARMKLPPGSMQFDEAEAAAYVGVLASIKRFDASRGIRLTTVVSWGVKAEMGRLLNPGAIHLPFNKAAMTDEQRVQAARVSVQATIGGRADEGCGNNYEPAYYDDPGKALENADSEEAEKRQLMVALDKIPERHRRILKQRFFEDRTLKEIGEEIGLTRERVRQLESDALRKMRCLLDPSA